MVKSIFLLLIMSTLGSAFVYADDLVESGGYLNVTIDQHIVRLEQLTIKRADLTGKLPIALITHGTPSTAAQMRDQRVTQLTGVARDFAMRGWLAVAVERRGFGSSDGPQPEPASCTSETFMDRFNADADDLQAALTEIGHRPDVDPTRVIAIGASTGGVAVMALGARNLPGLRAVINVSGGMRFSGCNTEDKLVAAFKEFAVGNHVPSFWIYALNDSFFGPDLVHRMRDAFLHQGGDSKMVMFKPLGSDGHTLFLTGRYQWLPELDGFLRQQQLPTWQAPDLLSITQKLKYGEKWRSWVELYLSAPVYKAMAQTVIDGGMWFGYGYNDMEGARQRALSQCKPTLPADRCDIVMENLRWVAQ